MGAEPWEFMDRWRWRLIGIGIVLTVTGALLLWSHFFAGDGALKRMVTRSGIYAVCKPGGYEAVCFLDADSADGGLSCLPLRSIQNESKCL